MKVTFILAAFPKLSETFVLSQITGLIDRGVDVRVIAGRPTLEKCVHGEYEKYNLDNIVTYVFPTPEANRKGLILRELARSGANGLRNVLPWKYGRKAINGQMHAWARTMKEVESRNKSDVVIAHFGGVGDLITCVRQTGAFAAPIAVVLHGFDMAIPIHLGKPLYPRLRMWADLLLPISNRWEKALLDAGFDQERVKVHRVGVNVPDAMPSRSLGEPVKLLSVCRFVEKKGIQYAIHAVKRLVENGKDILYTIVGNGPLEQQLHQLVTELQLDEHVTFTGPLPKEDVQKAMMSHDIFVAPSVTAASGDQEGIPTAIMESLSVGMLVASTRHSGIPELIKDGVNGLLADERDAAGLADAISKLIDSHSTAEGFREAGYKHVEQNFNIRRLNDRLFSLFESISET